MNAIYPSLISANLLCLAEEIETLEPYAAGFHLDVMDFHFVPNLTWGPDFINAIRAKAAKQLLVHLMVEYPEKYFDRFKLHPQDIISIHLESPSLYSLPELYKEITSRGWIPSIAINPYTPLEALISLTIPLKHVLLMSVEPGFSGQKFLPFILKKLKALNDFRAAHNLSFTISVDGGITTDIAKELAKNGANQLAIASAIFQAPNPVKALEQLSQ